MNLLSQIIKWCRWGDLSWICSTLGKFRNRTFGSSLLNFLAIRISLRSIRPQIRWTPKRVVKFLPITNKRGNDTSHYLFYGVVGGTWTPKDFSTRPSNVRVYRFRHYDIFNFQARRDKLVPTGGMELSLPSIQNLTFSQLLHGVLATTTYLIFNRHKFAKSAGGVY